MEIEIQFIYIYIYIIFICIYKLNIVAVRELKSFFRAAFYFQKEGFHRRSNSMFYKVFFQINVLSSL